MKSFHWKDRVVSKILKRIDSAFESISRDVEEMKVEQKRYYGTF